MHTVADSCKSHVLARRFVDTQTGSQADIFSAKKIDETIATTIPSSLARFERWLASTKIRIDDC